MPTDAPPMEGVVCCFPGQDVEARSPDPCSLVVETATKGAWQLWYCHSACFRARLCYQPGFEPVNF
jgi:hypothetical protein